MTEYYYPERMGRILLLAMEEVLGREGLNPVLRSASLAALIDHFPPAISDKTFPFETVSRLLESLEKAFGSRAGQGLAFKSRKGLLSIWFTRLWRATGYHRTRFSASALSDQASGRGAIPGRSIQQSNRPARSGGGKRGKVVLVHRTLPAVLAKGDQPAGLSSCRGTLAGIPILAERRQDIQR